MPWLVDYYYFQTQIELSVLLEFCRRRRNSTHSVIRRTAAMAASVFSWVQPILYMLPCFCWKRYYTTKRGASYILCSSHLFPSAVRTELWNVIKKDPSPKTKIAFCSSHDERIATGGIHKLHKRQDYLRISVWYYITYTNRTAYRSMAQ